MVKNKKLVVAFLTCLLFAVSFLSLNTTLVSADDTEIFVHVYQFDDPPEEIFWTVRDSDGNVIENVKITKESDGFYRGPGGRRRLEPWDDCHDCVVLLAPSDGSDSPDFQNPASFFDSVNQQATESDDVNEGGQTVNTGENAPETTDETGLTLTRNGDDSREESVFDSISAAISGQNAQAVEDDPSNRQTCTGPRCVTVIIEGTELQYDGEYLYADGQRDFAARYPDIERILRDEGITIDRNTPAFSESDGFVATAANGVTYHYKDGHYINPNTGEKYNQNGELIDSSDEERARQRRDAARAVRTFQLNSAYFDKPLMNRAATLASAARAVFGWFDVDISDWGVRKGWLELKANLLIRDGRPGMSGVLNFFFGGRQGISQACYAQQWGFAGDHRDADPSQGNVCGDACVRLELKRIDAGENVPLGRGRYSYIMSFTVQPPSCGEECGNCSNSWEYKITVFNENTGDEFVWVDWSEVEYSCSHVVTGTSSFSEFNVHTEFTHAKIEFKSGTNPRQHMRGFYGNTGGNEFVFKYVPLEASPDLVPGTEEEEESSSSSSEQSGPNQNTGMS